jgi:hypothetical protein
MEIAVLVERLDANGYRATSLGLDAASEAPTREAALDGLNRLLRDKLAAAELVRLEIPLADENHPWKPLIGRWRDHPDLEELEQHMRDYRRQVDEQGDRL